MAKIKVSKPDVIEIEFEEIPGKVFKIGFISEAFIEKITSADGPEAQAAIMFGCKLSDIKGKVDLRSLNKALNQVMDEVHQTNPPQADGEN